MRNTHKNKPEQQPGNGAHGGGVARDEERCGEVLPAARVREKSCSG
jgi:hypothetical protein